ncbi:MAG: hypothetical protein NWF00_10025 [Candidatus Bathyarchaeota archaeon]|nr:hypothetical protein [Candidatus Bathyarchaeota archaeon]
MNLPKQKIALAPVLAVVLALLLVGAATSFPPTQQERQDQLVSKGGVPSPQPQPSDNQFFQQSEAPSPTSEPPELPISSNTQDERTWPIPKPTTLPTPSPAPVVPTSSVFNGVLPLIFIVAAIVVAVVSVRVLFSEKDLNRTQ